MMRVLTYNIHGCIGSRHRFDGDAIVSVIEEADADIVALQEVHDDDDEDLSFLASLERLGYTDVIYGKTMRNPKGHYGNVLMTRSPVTTVREIDLSQSGWEPRGAIHAFTEEDGVEVEIVATHLGLGFGERREQLRQLIEECRPSGPPGSGVGILMGDLNEWNPLSRCNRLIRRNFGDARHPRTFPAWFPLFRLDRVHVLPRSTPCRLEVVDSANARTASDHLPLLADIEIEPAG